VTRFLAITLVSILIAFPTASSANDVTVTTGPNSFDSTAQEEQSGGASNATQPTSGGSTVTYVSSPICERGEGGDEDAYYGCGDVASCGDNGELYNVWAIDGGTTTHVGQTCVEDSAAGQQAQVLTPDRIRRAFEQVDVPTPPLTVQPPGGRTLVNFDTILHTQAEPFQATVQLLGRDVTFDITPAEYTWDLGRGETLTTTDPGRPWATGVPMSDYVSHRYLQAGDTTLTLATTWTARWRLNNGPWRDVDGTVTTETDPQPLEVVTARPQLIAYE